MKPIIMLIALILMLGCKNNLTKEEWDSLPEYRYHQYSVVPFYQEGFERWNRFPVMLIINRFNGDTVAICKVDTVKDPYVTYWGDAKRVKLYRGI